ncbi:MAG: undecaprenyldiphospho-muramoylpentapeptide beta-N-acetylglucosaminyltransferase [Candidatus Omnitrophota bacterium]
MKILLACGGTGGHIFPAISVAEELKRRDPRAEILYVCGKKDIENAIFKVVREEKVLSVTSAPFKGRSSLWNPLFLIKLMCGFCQSAAILLREKPDAVVGFGGYFSFPVILTAKAFGVPTLVHEQNVVPGVANQFLSRFVDGVAVSFEETGRLLPRSKKLRTTGNPIRSSIERDTRAEGLRVFGFSPGKETILVLGGSQGAESINTFFLEALPLLPAERRSKIQVLHLCGRMDPEAAEAVLKREGVPGRVYSFFERMDLAYGVCDLAVGRAGATFLAEIAGKNMPAILIPYPHGSGHQLVNAQAFARTWRATIVEQKDLTAEKLAGLLAETIEAQSGKREEAGGSASVNGAINARVLLADFIEGSISKK